MADQDEIQTGSHTQAVNRVAESLSLLLGNSYSPENLSQADNDKAQHERLYSRIAAFEARRQRNIEAIAKAAYEATDTLDMSEDASRADEDWMARFIGFAQDIGNPDMQNVWGHVLARQTAAPGCISFHVLECISKMLPGDLDLWEKAGRIAFPTGYLIKLGGRNEFEEFGIAEADIGRLKTVGLVQESDDLSVTFYAPTKGITFDFKGSDLVVRHPSSQLFTLPAFHLTGIGVELLPILADVPADMDYLKALGRELETEGYESRLRNSDGALIEVA